MTTVCPANRVTRSMPTSISGSKTLRLWPKLSWRRRRAGGPHRHPQCAGRGVNPVSSRRASTKEICGAYGDFLSRRQDDTVSRSSLEASKRLTRRAPSNFGERVGRHKACPYRGHGGRLGGTMWVGDRWHRQYAGDAAPTWHGVGGAALRGGTPRTREGRRPDRTTALVSEQRHRD